MNKIFSLYNELLKMYGPQGWWPLQNIGYHPKDYSYPKNKLQIWEIITGSLLTQNTSWLQVEKALTNLKNNNLLNPKSIIECDIDKLKQLIKPAGYYNQKSLRLKSLAEFFINLKETPTRELLLNQIGIGPETADSILLYAYKKPEFIVDTYTKRILNDFSSYEILKKKIIKSIPKDVILYQEFHALIVKHQKK